jgi:protease-4
MKFMVIVAVIAMVGVGIAYLMPYLFGLEIIPSIGGSVALIHVSGVISIEGGLDMSTLSSSTSSDTLVAYLEKAELTPGISAVVLEINSPGGGPVAGMEVARKIKSMTKPVIAWIREMGASAAYIIASACDKIVSSEYSIVGSLGATASYLSFGKTLDDYNVTYNQITTGKYKDMGSPYRDPTSEELEIYKDIAEKISNDVTAFVKENRPNVTNWTDVETARIYIGFDAKEIGLVDYIGSKDVLVSVLKNITKASTVTLIPFEQQSFDWLSLLTG